jgi:hypothetical protein
MKNCAFVSIAIMILISACGKKENTPEPKPTAKQKTASFRYTGSDYSQPITITEANTMIQSYLSSINYPENNTNLRSLTFDADTLRAYLNDSTRGKIATLKLMVAHQPQYAQSNYGIPAGMSANAITLIVVGLDENDNYIYNKQNMVYDHFRPCPSNCDNATAILPAKQ